MSERETVLSFVPITSHSSRGCYCYSFLLIPKSKSLSFHLGHFYISFLNQTSIPNTHSLSTQHSTRFIFIFIFLSLLMICFSPKSHHTSQSRIHTHTHNSFNLNLILGRNMFLLSILKKFKSIILN